MSAETPLCSGLLYGKLPGQKKWCPYYLELTDCDLHIHEGQVKSVQNAKGRQIRSLRLGQGDLVGEERSKKKRFKFFIQRPDGRYIFKCDNAEQRGEWIIHLQRTITEEIEAVLEANHGTPSSQNEEKYYDEIEQADPDGLGKYKWFWGHIGRAECDRRLRAEGRVGNFVIRINAEGVYVMSYLHVNGIVHSKIIHDGEFFHFDSSPVSAQGATIMEFVDSYMKTQHSQIIFPFGGSLHPNTPNQEAPVVNKVPPRDVPRRKHSDASTTVSTFKDLQKKSPFLTPPVKQKPLHVVRSDIHKAVSLEQLPSPMSKSGFISDIPKRSHDPQQKRLIQEQPLLVKHNALRAVQSVPYKAGSPEALPTHPSNADYVNVSPSGLQEKESLHQPFAMSHKPPPVKKKPIRAVQLDIRKATSLETLSWSTDYVNTSPSDQQNKEPLQQPFVASQVKHKPLHEVQSDVHKAVSFEAIPLQRSPEMPLGQMQLEYANWSSIYKNKLAKIAGGGVLPDQDTESSEMTDVQESKDLTTTSENQDYENWEVVHDQHICMSYTKM